MPVFVFARPVTTYEFIYVPASSEQEARCLYEAREDPDNYLEGEGDTLHYGDLELDEVKTESVTELLKLIADHASKALGDDSELIVSRNQPAHDWLRLRAELEWLYHLIDTRADALNAMPKSTVYPGDPLTTWTDEHGFSRCFSPSVALWELLSQAQLGGFPSVLERHARQFCIFHGSKISGVIKAGEVG